MQQILTVRGDKQIEVTISSARLAVDAHGKKRFVIALKYENEEDYRFLVATDMSWRTLDIAQAYTLRWLVDIFQSYCLHKFQINIANLLSLRVNDRSTVWADPYIQAVV